MLGGKTQKKKFLKKKVRKTKLKKSLKKKSKTKKAKLRKMKRTEKRVIDDVYRYKINLERLKINYLLNQRKNYG